MSKNKQSMKLYTEEQVREIYYKGIYNGRLHIEGKCSDEINSLTSIELPSDEEIGQEFKHSSENWEVRQALEEGAKWMRDKIQGGNNEQ